MHRRRRMLGIALAVALLSAACGPVVEGELPQLDAVARHVPEQSFVYDADGNQLAVLRQEFRESVALDELPQHLLDAVVAAEDQRFWDHGGIDIRAVARAALSNAAAGETEQGGSTITQQLVKMLYMPDADRTGASKVQEALLARQVESELDKREILEEYLNTAYFGAGAHGVQAAAWTYWRVDAADLTLEQSALLAGIIRSPETVNPARDPDAAAVRRDTVLGQMVALGSITAEQADEASRAPVSAEVRPKTPATTEPHWVDFVVRTLMDDPELGATEAERAQRIYGGGLRIHTTLRPRLQAAARATVTERLTAEGDPQSAIVAVEPATGAIVAAAGSVPYERLQFDLATQGRRQPGSTFKAFVVAAALIDGYRPTDRIDSRQGSFTKPDGAQWRVGNYEGRSMGMVTLEDATRRSVNTVFARLVLDVGPSRVGSLARAMGVRSPVPDDAQIAIGGGRLAVTALDMAAGYATLANLGEQVEASPIAYIEDAQGQVVWRPHQPRLRVISPGHAFVATQMLQQVVTNGTGTAARVEGWQVAGKTGTTDDYTDAWFAGYTPTLSAAVWVGHAEGLVSMRNVEGVPLVTGGSIPAQLWQRFMTEALAGTEPVDFSLPVEEWEVVEIDPITGLRAEEWCPGEPTAMPRVVAPRESCPSPAPQPSATPEVSPSASPSTGLPPLGGGLRDGEATPDPDASPGDGEPTPTESPTGTSPAPPDPSPTEGTPKPSPSPSPSPDADEAPSPEASGTPLGVASLR